MLGLQAKLLRHLRPPTWIVWLVLSAVLFLAGSATFGTAGQHMVAQLGVMGAVAAVAVNAAFLV